MPAAQIRINNEDTAALRSFTTDPTGVYVARNLPPGHYRVEVTLAGFQPQAKTGLVLTIDQTLTLNFSLAPGEQKEVISVVDRAQQLIEASTSSLGQVTEEAQIRELPLNGRNYQQLIGLTPGAQPAIQGTFTNGNYYMSGGRGDGNAALIDGLDVSQYSVGGPRTFVSPEGVGQFKVITNSYSAEYGRTLSGVVITNVKSGTNAYHGSLFEYVRNKELDARNFFAPLKPKYSFNQFGGSFGGPIKHDKLFIFGDWQSTRIRSGGPQLTTIPTPAQRAGDLSASPNTVYDPATGTTQRMPFPGNRIPVARFDKPSALMFSLLPQPNQGGAFNYLKVAGSKSDSDAFDIRTDYYATRTDRFSAVVTFSKGLSESEPIFPRLSGYTLTSSSTLNNRTASVNWTRVFSPTAVNELIVGLKRDANRGPKTEGMQYEADAGVRYLNTDPNDLYFTGFPSYAMAGYSRFGGPAGGPFAQIHNIPQLSDNFSLTRRAHAFKMGVAMRFRQFNLGQSVWPRGNLTFLSLPTSNNGTGGDPVASALLGYPSSAVRDFTPPYGERLREYGLYFQDDWKATRRLTLNLGLRWDYYPPATETHNRLSNYDLQRGVMIIAGQNGASDSTLEAKKRNFSPRTGFAYLLTSDGKTVLRGGFAMGYLLQQTSAVGTANERLTSNLPFRTNFSASFDFLNPTLRVSDGLFLPVPDPNHPTGDVYMQSTGDPTPRMQQWNLNIQRALPFDFMSEISYVGSHGVHLAGNVNLNQAAPGPTAPGPRSLYKPSVNNITAFLTRESSTYHALQMKLQRRFAHGFYILAGYTFSKSIDDGSFTSGAAADGSSSAPQDSRNWRAERGPSEFDIAHRFVSSYIYELPWGRGRSLMTNAPRLVEMILGGWQLNGITTLQSGNRFTPNVGNPRTNAGPGGSIRPDRIGSGLLSSGQQNIRRWFDKSAFVAQGTGGADPYHFGNSGRNILRGPRLVNFDASIFKGFAVTERIGLEFRAEFFNLFNTPHFNLPNRNVDTAQGGVISAAADPRLMQLALRLKF